MRLLCISLALLGFALGDYCQADPPIPSIHTNGLELKFVQVITRHGDRTPTGVLPIENVVWNCTLNSLGLFSDDILNIEPQPPRLYRKTYLPDREVLNGNCYLGQLTYKGLQQHFALGSQYRDLYVTQYELLPDQLSLENIWVRSTDVHRTIQSAQANLWGLYPPSSRGDDNVNIIDIHTMEPTYEDMYANPVICPRFSERSAELENSTEYIQFQQKMQPLMQQFMQAFNSTSPFSWGALSDNLQARRCHGLAYPPGVTEYMVDQAMVAASWELNYLWTDDEAGLLGMGYLVQEVYENLKAAVTSPSDLLYVYFSGHDSTVGPLSATLGGFDGVWPPYASHIEFEVWRSIDSGDYYVQMKYNGENPTILTCSDVMCPWDEFEELIQSRIPSDFTTACQIS